MHDDDGIVRQEIRGWIESDSADDVADYAARGRRFCELSNAELSAAWVRSFKAAANNFRNKDLRDVTSDYTSEFRIRSLQPPYDLVDDDLNVMAAAVKLWVASLAPDEEDELERRVEKHFQAFRTRVDKEKN